MSFTFISCSKDNTSENNENLTSKVNNIISSDDSKSDNEVNEETDLKYKDKPVSEVKINSSLGINIDVDAETLKALENAENDTAVPDVTLDMPLGTVEMIYTDETTETIGTVYLGEDKALYLKFENNKNKDAAYKLSDSCLF